MTRTEEHAEDTCPLAYQCRLPLTTHTVNHLAGLLRRHLIADVRLVLRRPAQERDSRTGLLDEGLNALTDDHPPISIEPALGHRIRRIRHDLALGPVDPAAEAVLVGIYRDVATRSQHPADRGLASP
jgi:hypothetical protein